MKKINCFFPAVHLSAVEKIAEREGTTRSVIHRAALAMYLEKYKEQMQLDRKTT
jgi:metal-responsive CopG/Arc/MetJ family transcriptional regulator